MERHWRVFVSGLQSLLVADAPSSLVARLELASGFRARRPRRGLGEEFIVESEADLARFCDQAQGLGLKAWVVEVARYSRSELQQAVLLLLSLDRAPKGMGGPAYGTRYDLSTGCSSCGTGATQISPLRVRASDLERGRRARMVETLQGEYLVIDNVATLLRGSDISGLEIRGAESTRGEPLSWHQITALDALPARDARSSGILAEGQCPDCRRDGHFGSPHEEMRLRYRTSETSKEVMRTWEHFGYSRLTEPFEQSHLASPRLLVQPRVMDLLLEAGIRGLHFMPVTFV